MEDSVRPAPTTRRVDSFAMAAGMIAPLTWGLTGVFVRLLHGAPTLAIVTGRLLIAALVLGPWLWVRGREARRPFNAALAAVMGAYYILATEAFARAPVVEVTLIVGSAPVIAVVLERTRGIRPVRQQLVGAVVAVAGLVLFLAPGVTVGSDRALAYLFAFGAAAASAAYAVWLRAGALGESKPDPLALTVGACLLGSVASLLLLGPHVEASVSRLASPADLIYLVLLGTVSTAVPTLAFGIASVKLPSVVTTSLGLTTPLFAAVFAGLFLDEWPAPASIPGALVTITGVTIVLRAPLRPVHHA